MLRQDARAGYESETTCTVYHRATPQWTINKDFEMKITRWYGVLIAIYRLSFMPFVLRDLPLYGPNRTLSSHKERVLEDNKVIE